MLVLVAPLAAVAALLLLLFPARLNSAALEGAHQRALAVTDVVARAAGPAVDFDDPEHAGEVLATISDDPEVVAAALRGHDGKLLAFLPTGAPEIARTLPRATPAGSRTLTRDGELLVFAPVTGRAGSSGTLVISMSLSGVAAQQHANQTLALAAAGITLAVGIALSLLATSLLLRRRRAEAALARSERNLSAVTDASPDAMIVHREGRMSYVNPAARRLDPRGGEALGGRDIGELLPQVPWPGAASVVSRVKRSGQDLSLEVRSLAITFDGAPATLTIARDVTDVHRMQAQLVLADRMASVGTLAAGVAHEINNPLAFVSANLAFAIDALRTPEQMVDPNDLLAALSDAQQGSDRVGRIVRDLKTFSRADDERREPIELHTALDLSLQMTATTLKHKATVVKRYGTIPRVDASDSRLGQVFVNLLVNAAQALPDDGKHHTVEVSTHTDGDGRAVVTIKDSGRGIPAEIVSRIFDPFFTTKPVGVGTGLGLSICHNIITALGGEIVVESQVGAGTTFKVVLPPSAASTALEQAAVPVPENAARRGRVLVIDDEPLVARAVRRSLDRDAEVVSESRAADALTRLEGGQCFDVILCDLMMPEMTGLDFYRALRSSMPEQLAKLIFVTGAITEVHDSEIADRPRIEKPFNPSDLRKAVKQLLEGMPAS